MDALDALSHGPWREHGLMLVPARYRRVAQRPPELNYLRTRITYTELFGTRPTWDLFFERLADIGLHTLMATLSYINSVLRLKGTLAAQDEIVSGTFDADLIRGVKRLPQWRGRIVYSSPQILMVMKAAVLHSPNREDVRDTAAYGRQAAEVLLIANDLLDPTTDAAVDAARNRPQLIAAFLAHSIRSTLANYTERYEYALARASILFTQLAARADVRARAGNAWIDAENRFRATTGLSLADYFACGFAVVGWFRVGAEHRDQVNQRKLIPDTFFSQTQLDPALGRSLLNRLMHDRDSAQRAFNDRQSDTRLFGYDVVPFMHRPLYRIRDDVAVPASLAFLEARVTTGVFWLLRDSMPTAKERLRFSAFYGHVVEAYVHDAFRRALPDGAGLARRVFSDFTYATGMGERRTSDVVIVYPGAAVFMEVTTTRLGMDATILVDDPDAVNADIEKIVIKKARQLHNRIQDFRQNRYDFDGITTEHVASIVPVVVTAEPIPMWTATMDTIRTTLAQRGLLQGVGVAPLRVIGVDEVELLEPLVGGGHNLYQILKSHADDAGYTNVSLHNFLAAHYQVPLNDVLRAQFDVIAAHAGRLLFGRDIRQPTHESIALRAYELFERRGREHGRDLDDWLQAERELRSC